MIVCSCRVVSDRRIREAVAAGATTVIAVGRMIGAGTGCGMCRRSINELVLRERHRATASAEAAVRAADGRHATG
jgi:bacterioferritin-associated ferredoxin